MIGISVGVGVVLGWRISGGLKGWLAGRERGCDVLDAGCG